MSVPCVACGSWGGHFASCVFAAWAKDVIPDSRRRPRLESGSWQAFGCTDPGDMEPCAAVLCGWPHGHRVDAGTNVADVLLPRACTALDALGGAEPMSARRKAANGDVSLAARACIARGKASAFEEAWRFLWDRRDADDWDISDAIEWLRERAKKEGGKL